jgi:hypothetical protein
MDESKLSRNHLRAASKMCRTVPAQGGDDFRSHISYISYLRMKEEGRELPDGFCEFPSKIASVPEFSGKGGIAAPCRAQPQG